MAEYIRGKYLDVQNEQKNRYTFLGILQGVTCDGNITIGEVNYILAWLTQHRTGMEVIPELENIKDLLSIMSRKQIIVDSDEIKLKNMLNDVSGSQWETTGDTINMPINLYDRDTEIYFEDCIFVLTGNFGYGLKKEFEQLIESLGGQCEKNVTANTNYLIVGHYGSKDWTHNSWGTKIEKANKINVPIISEEQWLESLKNHCIVNNLSSSMPKKNATPIDFNSNWLKDKKVVVTGVASNENYEIVDRKEVIFPIIKKLGGDSRTSISGQTDILITIGDCEENSKYVEAQKMGIYIVDFEKFKQLYKREFNQELKLY